jgi:hypothetical protein
MSSLRKLHVSHCTLHDVVRHHVGWVACSGVAYGDQCMYMPMVTNVVAYGVTSACIPFPRAPLPCLGTAGVVGWLAGVRACVCSCRSHVQG